VLEGPNWNLPLTGSATMTTLPADVAELLAYDGELADGLALTSAEGNGSLIVGVGSTSAYNTVPHEEKPQSLQVVVDGEPRRLTMVPGPIGGDIVLSVPVGAQTFFQAPADSGAASTSRSAPGSWAG